MKRTLEADFDETSQTLQTQYTRALAISQRLFTHIRKLYDQEAMYSSSGLCYFKLMNPDVSFDWENVGLNDTPRMGTDRWLITADGTIRFEKLFDFLLENAYTTLTTEEHLHCRKVLTNYFLDNPNTDLVIDTWGDDSKIRGGKIGASTDFVWIEEEPESWEKESEEDDDEEEEEGIHPSMTGGMQTFE
jgi:hypothetical protein